MKTTNLKKMALAGLVSGLCIITGSLSAANIQGGTQIARGGCGHGCSGSGNKPNPSANVNNDNDSSATTVKPTDSDSSDNSITNKKPNTDTTNSTNK